MARRKSLGKSYHRLREDSALSGFFVSLAFVALTASGAVARAEAQPSRVQPSSLDVNRPEIRLVIDTIVVDNENIFSTAEERQSFVFRLINKLHIKTRPFVIRRELLFATGQQFDSLRVAETERNLRRRLIFREVSIDTTRIADKLAVVVRTRDGWSTRPKIGFSASSDGTVTATLGVTEYNLFGTGQFGRAWYVKGVDRSGAILQTRLDRLGGSPLLFNGSLFLLSDGTDGFWFAGVPYRAFEDRRAFLTSGEASDQRILQFTASDTGLDTVQFQRQAFISRVSGSFAPIADRRRFLRVGGTAEVRQEKYFARQDLGMAIPDSVTVTVGAFATYSRGTFQIVRRFNGFAEEDVDLSTTVRVSAKLAPAAFGWASTGIGPRIDIAGGKRFGPSFTRAAVSANALFNGAGLDSGRVVFRTTTAVRPSPRHVTVLHARGGVLDSPPPGGEFDLGFDVPPRGFPPHAFVGTRSVSATLEHRWYMLDHFLNLIGLGVAAFVDYGGAWYADQGSRFGGNVGVGLRLGSAFTTGIGRPARIDVAYLFGDGVTGRTGSRWAFSFGPSFIF